MTAAYDEIAEEYYDPERHPTCANFEELSTKFIIAQLFGLISDDFSILEVGAGKSVVAQFPKAEKCMLIVLDESVPMLSHSKKLVKKNVQFKIAKAHQTGLPDQSVDIIVSSLGDPYNTSSFWKEVSRLLKTGGVCLFTCPAGEWANSFRVHGKRDEAEFVLRDGRSISVPSVCLNFDEQTTLIRSAGGLTVIESMDFRVADITGFVSPKLRGPSDIVLRGFVVAKAIAQQAS